MTEDRRQNTNDFCSSKIIAWDMLGAALKILQAYGKQGQLVYGMFTDPDIGQAFFPANMVWSHTYNEPWLWVGVLADITTDNVPSKAVKERAERLATLPFVDQVFFYQDLFHLAEIVNAHSDVFSAPLEPDSLSWAMLVTRYGGQEFDPESPVALTESG